MPETPETFDTPVVFILFNRPETTQKVFDTIAAIRPSRLLLIADGPRPSHPRDAVRCREARAVTGRIDWPCQVHRNFSEVNLGSGERIISGLNWVFSLVEEAVILEDDCLPHPSFFPYCRELLARYRDDPRVYMISGNDFVEKHVAGDRSYFFSRMPHIWGWATWRRAWSRLDLRLNHWPEIRESNLLAEIFDDPRVLAYWTEIFDVVHRNLGFDGWDYRLNYTIFVNNLLSITPRVNMVANIGFGPEATRTKVAIPKWMLPAQEMRFPLLHPPAVIPMRSLDRKDQLLYLPPRLPLRAVRKLRRILAGAQR